MFYLFLRFWIGLAMRAWFRRVYRHFEEELPSGMPIIFACNHPNSAIDFLHVGLTVNKPVHVLVRGDVFEKPMLNKIFRGLWMIPIYRIRDGFSSLSRNEDSFSDCYDLFDQKGMVHIFSEGICFQEKKLQPLKKGTARLALDYYASRGQDIAVVPVGVNYTVFRLWRNSVMLRYGKIFKASEYAEAYATNPATAYIKMTTDLEVELKKCVIEFPDYEDNSLAEKALMALRMDRPLNDERWTVKAQGYFQQEQALAHKVRSWKADEFPELLRIESSQITGDMEGLLSAPRAPWKEQLTLAVTAPLMILCAIPLLLPVWLSKRIVQTSITDKIFHTTVMILGTLVFYLLQLIIISAIAVGISGFSGWFFPVAIIASSAIGISISDAFLVSWSNRKWWNKQEKARKLLAEVKQLIATSPSHDSMPSAPASSAAAV